MWITFDPYLLRWLQQVAPKVGLKSEGSPRAKLKLKYWHMVLRKNGVRPLKISFWVSNTLSGIETSVKYGKFRKLRTIPAIYMPLFKAEGTQLSEGRLLELLQTVEKHCSRLPSLGTLALGTREKTGSELEKLLCKGESALACIHLVNLGTDKTHLRTFSDPR